MLKQIQDNKQHVHALIYTDASMRNKVGAWSAYISIQGQSPKLVSGFCPLFIQTAAQAETYAILRGIIEAKKINCNISKINIRTDCMGLTRTLHPRGRRTRFYINKTIQEAIIKETRGKGIRLVVKYVRGHQSGDHTEARLNRMVDYESRKIRRYQEQKFLYEKKKINWIEHFKNLFLYLKPFKQLYFRYQLKTDLNLLISK